MIKFKTFVTVLALVSALSACGGGSPEDNQQINQVKTQTLSFGKNAVIQIAGLNLRASMTATTGICLNPAFNSAQSVPELAVLNCTVNATGVQPLTITGSKGQILYAGTLTVPLPQVTMITSLGNVTVELDPAVAPVSVINFLTYTNSGYYGNTLFHRVIPGFVAQGGGYSTGLVKKPGQREAIQLESNNGLSNTRGSLAMARTNDPNSATSEFFINLVDNLSLDYQSEANPGYAVFGKVVQGMDIVDEIGAVPTITVNDVTDVPATDVIIQLAIQTK